MAALLYKLGRFAFRRRWTVTLTWLLLLVGVVSAAAAVSANPSSSISIPGTEAQRAFDLLAERFPAANADGATARVVFKAPKGEKITDKDNQAAVQRTVAQLRSGSSQVGQVTDPYEAKAISRDGSTAYSQVSYKVLSFALTDADRGALEKAAEGGRDSGLTVETGGDALQAVPKNGATEVIGVAVAAVVLIITFGAMVAAGLPLLTAIIGVGISVAGISALSEVLDLNSTTPTLAMMIGLAVGIDYALFIVSRHRAELAQGRAPEEAIGRALGTAGSAVVFAGLTVVIALAGLAVVGIPILTKMGLAASAAVVMAVLIAITLIPALLGFAGRRVLSRSVRKNVEGDPAHDAKPNGGTRWARFVLRRPIPVLLAGVIGLGVLAVPVSDMELGLPDDGSQSVETTQRKAYDMLAEAFGPGFNGPLLMVVDTKDSADSKAAADHVVKTVSGMKDVAAVVPGMSDKAGDTTLVTVIPKSSPTSADTERLVKALRGASDDIHTKVGADVYVTGQAAMAIDVSQKMSDALLPYLALVVGLAFLLLMLVFRSVLVPLKAALGFLLSVLAALGSVVAVFQWGWLADVFGVDEPGPIMSMMPIFMVGVVFGLAMDYEVFLVTRIREAHIHGEPFKEAVVTGFAHGARVVTAAAVIMISVFAGFIGSDEVMVRMIGFGLAIAVLFDAFVVRMAIVPAALALLHEASWWLPRWLDKMMPNVDVEGEGLQKYLSAGDPALSKASKATLASLADEEYVISDPAAEAEAEAGAEAEAAGAADEADEEETAATRS